MGADKPLARPVRKQATATKLGRYSTYSPRSSIHFLARCYSFRKSLKKKKTQNVVRPTRYVCLGFSCSCTDLLSYWRWNGLLPLQRVLRNLCKTLSLSAWMLRGLCWQFVYQSFGATCLSNFNGQVDQVGMDCLIFKDVNDRLCRNVGNHPISYTL